MEGTGGGEASATKLVSRTIDAILEFSKHRLVVHRKTERKNGLELPKNMYFPGFSTQGTYYA